MVLRFEQRRRLFLTKARHVQRQDRCLEERKRDLDLDKKYFMIGEWWLGLIWFGLMRAHRSSGGKKRKRNLTHHKRHDHTIPDASL
tara:strand:+ start:352 stop:609 length:258 start_codon:yes stop_codon:yes gene_type:complete